MKTYRSGRVPCRCRKCLARKTLNKHPDKYVNPPKCPRGCGGVLREDKYRRRRGPKDHPPECTDGLCPENAFNSKHRVSNSKCIHNAAYIAERNSKPRSKHSPIPESEWVPF